MILLSLLNILLILPVLPGNICTFRHFSSEIFGASLIFLYICTKYNKKIIHMKRFFTLFLVVFMSIPLESQDSNMLVLEKLDQLTNKHLAFDGILIKDELTTLTQKLESRGYNLNAEPYTRKAGKFANMDFDQVILSYNNHNIVYGITIIREMSTYDGCVNTINMLDKYIRQTYPKCSVRSYSDTYSYMNSYVYTIDDLGSIKLESDNFKVSVRFIDKSNYEWTKGVEIQWYNLQNIYPSAQKCFMGISEDEVLFYTTINEKDYSFSARGDDKIGITTLVKNGKNFSLIKLVLNKYISSIVNKSEYEDNIIPIYYDELNPICETIYKERILSQTNQQTIRQAGQNILFDLFIDAVMSKKDQNYYDSLFGRDGLRALTKGIIGIATYQGEGEYSCSTCGLRFASYIEKRNHENSNHGY